MALTTCPDCGKEISTLATACPNCGRPMEKYQAPLPEGRTSCPDGTCTGVLREDGRCGTCGKSDDWKDDGEEFCPTPATQKNSGHAMAFIFLAVIIFLIVAKGLFVKPEPPNVVPHRQEIASTEPQQITSDSRVGCTDRDYFSKLTGFVADGDKQAFARGLSTGISRGVCTIFSQGEEVFISDTAVFSGVVKLHRKGNDTEYWTAMEAIQ